MSLPALPLILASSSPRREELMAEAGYEFRIDPPADSAECGICSRETPPEMVARLAWQKAGDVAARTAEGLVIGCDTLVECHGNVLGKPVNRQHAREMLRLLQGRVHHVYSGICLWERPGDRTLVKVARSSLRMDELPDSAFEEHLDSGDWEGKAGAFGFQNRYDWLHLVEGSVSNIVGLPMELLAEMLSEMSQPPAAN